MTKTVLLLITVTMGAIGHASKLAPKIDALVAAASPEEKHRRTERARQLIVEVLKMLGSEQSALDEPLPFDRFDAAALFKAVDEFAPIIIGGTLPRLSKEDNHRLIALMDDDARATIRKLDGALGDDDREGLRRLYPVMIKAAFGRRPSLLATVINTHLITTEDLAGTGSMYGWGSTLRSIAILGAKSKLGWIFGDQVADDMLYVQTFIALAKYLGLPEDSAFCQTKLDRA